MNKLHLVAAITALSVGAPAALATGTAPAFPVGESHEQKCNRWASYDDLKGDKLAGYVKDCMLDLRVPDAPDDGGGE